MMNRIVSLWRGKRSDEMENGTEHNELLVVPFKQIYTAFIHFQPIFFSLIFEARFWFAW
jgi:hypothetical protein